MSGPPPWIRHWEVCYVSRSLISLISVYLSPKYDDLSSLTEFLSPVLDSGRTRLRLTDLLINRCHRSTWILNPLVSVLSVWVWSAKLQLSRYMWSTELQFRQFWKKNKKTTRMHSSRMRTARSLIVSRRIPCMPPLCHACPFLCHTCMPPWQPHIPLPWQWPCMFPPWQPCTPPSNHTHSSGNQACPWQPHMPPSATTHAPWQPCTPPYGQNHRRLWKYNLAPTSLQAVMNICSFHLYHGITIRLI